MQFQAVQEFAADPKRGLLSFDDLHAVRNAGLHIHSPITDAQKEDEKFFQRWLFGIIRDPAARDIVASHLAKAARIRQFPFTAGGHPLQNSVILPRSMATIGRCGCRVFRRGRGGLRGNSHVLAPKVINRSYVRQTDANGLN